MSDAFRDALRRCYAEARKARFEIEKEATIKKIMQDYPCEAAAHKLLEVAKLVVYRHECGDYPIDPQDLAEANGVIYEADPDLKPKTDEAMDALMEIYMLATNPVSEQGCTYDVDFICLINKMRWIAKKVIEKSEEK